MGKLLVRTLVGAFWLPLAVLAVFMVGDYSMGPVAIGLGQLLPFVVLMWLLGIPLALAVLLIHRRKPGLAWVTALICAPLSVFAFYLSVPLPSFLNTLFGAALGWIVLASRT